MNGEPRGAATLLTRDVARHVAADIAKLPGYRLLRRRPAATNPELHKRSGSRPPFTAKATMRLPMISRTTLRVAVVVKFGSRLIVGSTKDFNYLGIEAAIGRNKSRDLGHRLVQFPCEGSLGVGPDSSPPKIGGGKQAKMRPAHRSQIAWLLYVIHKHSGTA